MRSRIQNATIDGANFSSSANDHVLSLSTTSNFTIPSPASGTDQIAPPVIALNSTSTSINITLPAAPGGNKSASYMIQNASSGTCNHTVQDPTGPTTVAVLAKGEIGFFFSIASTWYGYTAPAGTNYVDGVTPGTVTASKAVVVDANKTIGTFASMTASVMTISSATVSTASLTAPTIGSATVSTMLASSNVSFDANVGIGASSQSTLGFYGFTPQAQKASAALTATLSLFSTAGASYIANTSATVSGVFGFTSNMASNLVDAITEIRALVSYLGLHKAGA